MVITLWSRTNVSHDVLHDVCKIKFGNVFDVCWTYLSLLIIFIGINHQRDQNTSKIIFGQEVQKCLLVFAILHEATDFCCK